MQPTAFYIAYAKRLYATLGVVLGLIVPDLTYASGYSISSDGFVTRSDGSRTFPLGIFDVPTSDTATVRDRGFQAIARFWADSFDDRSFLQQADDLRMFGIVGIDSDQVGGSQTVVRNFVRNYVSSLDGVPPPIAYLLPDEFLSKNYSLSKLSAIKDAIKSIDPTALTIYDDWTQESAVRAKDVYDIFAWDAYPVGSQGESIESWRNNMRRIMDSIRPKPFWLTLQAFVYPPGWTEPTRDELRTMAYTAIANGATGLIAYAYDYYPHNTGIYDYPELWQNLSELMVELKSNMHILTKPDLARTISTSVNGIDCKLKKRKGKYYLIAANYKSGVKLPAGHYGGVNYPSVQFAIDGLGNGVVRTLTGGDTSTTTIPMTAGVFTDAFPAYGARIYEITRQ